MTNSSKKKKEKTADFTKRRLKLGKGKQVASNAVDTSFKARSIALPQQSIATTKDTSAPTTKRKLTFEDLLGHLKHYSAGIRKDALQGLYELLNEHSELIEVNLSRLIGICARLISDEDASVRKALHTFLSWLLPRIPRESLTPHAPTLLLFTASAQSHIFPEIRIDAIRVLDLLLEFVPEQVVNGLISPGAESKNGHGRKLLDGYLGLLNVGARFSEDESKIAGPSSGVSMTLVTLSTASKAMLLKSFSKFMMSAVAQEGNVTDSDHPDIAIPLWYLSSSFSSPESYSAFSEVLSLQGNGTPCHYVDDSPTKDVDNNFVGEYSLAADFKIHRELDKLSDLELVIQEIEGLSNKNSSDDITSSSLRLISSICRSIHSVLVSTFLDCAPSVFSPTQLPAIPELELILSLMEVSRSLYGRILRDGSATQDQKLIALEELRVFVNHMSVYFPFGENRLMSQDIKIDIAFQKMNLIYCELYSLQSFNRLSEDDEIGEGRPPSLKKRKLNISQNKKSKGFVNTSGDKQAEMVREYVVQCLQGTTVPGSHSVLSPLGQVLTPQAFIALLPTLWWLLNTPERRVHSTEVIQAILRHAVKSGSTSGVKKAATEFAGRLALLQCERSYRGFFRVTLTSPEEEQQVFREWILHLPKALWELGDKNPITTELILLFLLRATQRRLWMVDTEALCIRLVPFFTMQHATRGELRGPYARLPEASSPESNFSDPKNKEPRRKKRMAHLKHLALDVAATLVSNSDQVNNLTPQKAITKKVEKSTLVSEKPKKENSVSAGSASTARQNLRLAVEKAVVGTPEEGYWNSIISL